MIDLYTWRTPNGYKASIALEEMGLDYEVHPINIMKDEQFAPEFLKISPNNRIPAIVDRDTGMSLFESGAILMYLAEKTGMFLPQQAPDKWKVIEWLMWQIGGHGPMLGQAHHFLHFNKQASDYAAGRYGKEAARLYGVLERQLEGREFVAGDISIADFAIFPWTARFEWQGLDINNYTNVVRWYRTMAARPGVQRGVKVPDPSYEIPMP